MLARLPAQAADAATQAGLGRRTGVFRSARRLPGTVVWLIAGAACVGSVLVVVWLGLVGLVVMPVVLGLLAAYRYLLPPAQGWRWLAVHDEGFVDVPPAASGTPSRVARWSEVTGVDVEPYPIDGFTLHLAPPEQVSLTDLAPRARLIDRVARHLPGSIPPARRAGWDQRAARARLAALGLAALVLVPLVGLVARASGDQSGPGADTGPSQAVVFDPLASGPPFSPSPLLPAAESPTALPSLAPPLPDDVVGYGDVCTGTVFPEAPAYSGPGPHYIYISYMSKGDAFMDTPSAWESDDVAKVQLVACVTWSTGARLRTCRYQGDHGKVITQKLVRTTWDITIRETSTGRIVAHSRFSGGNTTCDESILTFGGRADPVQYADPTQRQLQDAIGRYIG